MRRRPIISLLLIFSLAIAALSQTKPRMTPADYGKWETLGAASLSPDGKWLAYGVNRSNRNSNTPPIISGDHAHARNRAGQ
jgi:hypothetical protein